ncbi:ATP-binding cassette domain-containing protein [Streptomyces sp. GLT-R25]
MCGDGRHPRAPKPTPAADLAPRQPATATATGEGAVVLRLEHVSVAYGGLKALEDASVSLRQDEVLAVIGPNGAGKTTLLNAVSGLTGNGRVSGTVDFAGGSLLKARATARRRLGIGRTFQHAEVFSELTVAENVLCTRRWITARDRADVARLLDSVGLADVADRRPGELPFGLQKRPGPRPCDGRGTETPGAGRAVRRPGRRRTGTAGTADQAAARTGHRCARHRPRARRPVLRRTPGAGLRLRPHHRRGHPGHRAGRPRGAVVVPGYGRRPGRAARAGR